MVVGKEMIYDINNLLMMNQIISVRQITEHQLEIWVKTIVAASHLRVFERSIQDNMHNIDNIIIDNVDNIGDII